MSDRVIGMWSEDIFWTVRQEVRRARLGVAKVMSGEVCCVSALYGLRVGEFGQFSVDRECSCWERSVPLGSGS